MFFNLSTVVVDFVLVQKSVRNEHAGDRELRRKIR